MHIEFVIDSSLVLILHTVESCATKKKACKNCSCGRAEEEAKEAAAKPLTGPLPNSSCGNVCNACLTCFNNLAFLMVRSRD